VCKRQRAFLHHLDIALGSEGELEVQLEIAQRLGFAAQKDIEAVANRVADVGRPAQGNLAVGHQGLRLRRLLEGRADVIVIRGGGERAGAITSGRGHGLADEAVPDLRELQDADGTLIHAASLPQATRRRQVPRP